MTGFGLLIKRAALESGNFARWAKQHRVGINFCEICANEYELELGIGLGFGYWFWYGYHVPDIRRRDAFYAKLERERAASLQG